ncbi:MAG: HD domain-containing protein [Chloroflexota bacterium]
MSEANERIKQIAEFAREHLEQAGRDLPASWNTPAYRWQHTLRVAHYGKLLAEVERANVEWVVAACLLHDVAHFEAEEDYSGHGRLGAQISRPFLQSLGYGSEAVNAICYAIAVHVDGDAGFEHEETLEAKVVSDADNIDRFGAFRILQNCVYELQAGMGDMDQLADALGSRLQKLHQLRQGAMLETPEGERLFVQQIEHQIAFFQALAGEAEITRLPELPQRAGLV